EWTQHRLLYLSEPLEEPLHLSGTPTVTIRLASSRTAANLSVWLVSLPWDDGKKSKITDNIITRGWADPQNQDSLKDSSPLTPGKYRSLTFELQPDDQIIAKGQQLAWMIFSSDQDHTLWPRPGTELTIDLEASSLTLPIVGGKGSLAFALDKVVASDPAPPSSSE
ncbi:MAG TPA: hypothetical protein DIV36_06505, partial [Verrucomicrobiales bacterium]|nr:hypothetical protein [Verrucomicrobiales bacterium]